MLFTILSIKNKFDNYLDKVNKNYFITVSLVIGLSFTVLSFFAPSFFLSDLVKKTKFFNQDSGYVGDTIGGITNPFIGIAGITFTFLAFYMQKLANDDIKNQFKIQQFENQFFEMLRLHKENINEMRITGYEILIETSKLKDSKGKLQNLTETYTNSTRLTEGRKVFVTMNTELIACYEFLEYFNNLWNTNIPQVHLLDLAYKLFFFGSKSNIVSSDNIESHIIDNFKIQLNNIRKTHKNSSGVKNTYSGLNQKIINLHIKYLPFSGHENRLGHYYRHLYSTVKYVVNKEKEGLINYKQSREYLKILRSQMSNDEQLMLYYNYIIGFGKDWEKDQYLTKYRMLHNLPIDSVKYVENPRDHFRSFINSINSEDKDDLFEWGD